MQFTTKYPSISRNGYGYGRGQQQTIRPQTLAPPRIFEYTAYSNPLNPPPATRGEVYGLALGACFLALLICWMLWVVVRSEINPFLTSKSSKKVQRIDIENGNAFQQQESLGETRSFFSRMRRIPTDVDNGDALSQERQHNPQEGQSLLSMMRRVSADELIRSARQKSVDVATGFRRDVGEFVRIPPTRWLDEEAALGGAQDGGTVNTGGSFLRRARRTVDVLSV
ncbi:hypothetical protein AAE478_003725 [Parahypoxylon ruwenzoriense]